MLALELLDEVVDETVIEILTTKVSVTSGGLDFVDTLLDDQEGNIESPASYIEDGDVAFTSGLLIETVGDSSRRLVDDTEDVDTRDGTGVLRGEGV